MRAPLWTILASVATILATPIDVIYSESRSKDAPTVHPQHHVSREGNDAANSQFRQAFRPAPLIETARTAIVTSDTRKRHRGRPTEPVAKKMTRFKKSDDKANEVDPHTKETESITIAPHETPSWRRDKAKALGLKGRTAFPMFSHRLSAKEIKEHPQFDKWHMHRQAMQNEILEQWQLPPHFQSMKGRYVFPTKKKVSIPKQGETAKEQRDRQDRKNTSERSRHAKLRDLKLHRSSAVPSFARTLSVGSLKDSSHINDWHKHREMMETGTMEQKDLPLKFKSRIPGKLILRDIDMKEKPIDEKETKKQIKSLQKQERSAKLKELYLHRNSATPIFAQNMKAEDIKHYDEIDNWHHHRDALQRGSIKESDLPDHFKPNRGALKFRLRPYLPDEQRSKENGASASQFNNGPRSQMVHSPPFHHDGQDRLMSGPENEHNESGSNQIEDPLAFLHSMLLD